MTDQPSLFDQPEDEPDEEEEPDPQPGPDPVEGARRRDEGIRRAEEGAGPTWNDIAYEALVEVANRGERFTSEAVRTLLIERGHWPPPGSPTSLGGVMTRGKAAGLIELTGDTTRSVYASSNRMVKNYWRLAE